MKLIIDAMGGDNAPGAIVAGAVRGCREQGVFPVFVGDAEKIKAFVPKGFDCRVVHTDDVIEMEDPPMSIIREHRESSMGKGLALLKTEGDAFLSAGSTGALVTGASSRVVFGKTRGIRRAMIASVLPLSNPVLLADSGANLSVDAEELVQFARMGSVYMQKIFGIASPRVALVNNGAEPTKGPEIYREAYALLEDCPDINFVGNAESRDIPLGFCDVAVCDGFVGNVILKLCEGFGKFMGASLKEIFAANPLTKLGGLLTKNKFKDFRARLSSARYGGAPVLGIPKPVIKAHGDSDENAVAAAVGQAKFFFESGICGAIGEFAAKDREENI
ncbi:MAG: phosphate acyltransferase PlsX [Clostridia bacterium]|nr:phosphate acyltransferase PlsX [Clostridia bacterium]